MNKVEELKVIMEEIAELEEEHKCLLNELKQLNKPLITDKNANAIKNKMLITKNKITTRYNKINQTIDTIYEIERIKGNEQN